jgi:choline dehydrogenase
MHDIVIVGAGTAGCVLASRLTEDPDVSVLLIEAGARSRKLETKIPAAFSRLFRTDVDWGDSTTPQGGLDGREIVFPRGRMLGGTAAMNAMMVLRGHPADYDDWAARGCPGWSWADVEPSFARSAREGFPLAEIPDRHVLAEAFVHAAQAVGIPFTEDLNADDNAGVGFVPVSQRRAAPASSTVTGPGTKAPEQPSSPGSGNKVFSTAAARSASRTVPTQRMKPKTRCSPTTR